MLNRSDIIVGLFATLNVTLDGVVKALVSVGPAASALFTLFQILVAGITLVYIALKCWSIIVSLRKKPVKRRRRRRTSRK